MADNKTKLFFFFFLLAEQGRATILEQVQKVFLRSEKEGIKEKCIPYQERCHTLSSLFFSFGLAIFLVFFIKSQALISRMIYVGYIGLYEGHKHTWDEADFSLKEPIHVLPQITQAVSGGIRI